MRTGMSNFFHKATHGGDLYASAIARTIEKMANSGVPGVRVLPDPLISDAWDDAGMYDPQEIAVFDANWMPLITKQSALKQFQGWFHTLMTADKPGASFTFFFEGDQFGIFDIGGPEVGQISVRINDQPVGMRMVTDRG